MSSLAHFLYWTNLYLITAFVLLAQTYLCIYHPLFAFFLLAAACWWYSASPRLRLLLRLLYLDHPLSLPRAIPKALQREAQLYHEDAKEEEDELEAYCANLAKFVSLVEQ